MLLIFFNFISSVNILGTPGTPGTAPEPAPDGAKLTNYTPDFASKRPFNHRFYVFAVPKCNFEVGTTWDSCGPSVTIIEMGTYT
jgi:hypothetical protein